MDIVKEVKTLLNVKRGDTFERYFGNLGKEYLVISGKDLINLVDVDAWSSGDCYGINIYTSVKPLSEEQSIYLLMSEGIDLMPQQQFLEKLRSLINDKG